MGSWSLLTKCSVREDCLIRMWRTKQSSLSKWQWRNLRSTTQPASLTRNISRVPRLTRLLSASLTLFSSCFQTQFRRQSGQRRARRWRTGIFGGQCMTRFCSLWWPRLRLSTSGNFHLSSQFFLYWTISPRLTVVCIGHFCLPLSCL